MSVQRVKTGLVSRQHNFPKETAPDLLIGRRQNAEGVIVGIPREFGGEAFLIAHKNSTLRALYWINEFSLQEA